MLHGILRCSPLREIIHIGIEIMPLGLSVGEGDVIEELAPDWSSFIPASDTGIPDPTSEQGIRRCNPFSETMHIGIDTVGTWRPRRRPPCAPKRLGASARSGVNSSAFAPALASRAIQASSTTARSCAMLGVASFPLLALQRAGISFSFRLSKRADFARRES